MFVLNHVKLKDRSQDFMNHYQIIQTKIEFQFESEFLFDPNPGKIYLNKQRQVNNYQIISDNKVLSKFF